jgi:hypothetical protein
MRAMTWLMLFAAMPGARLNGQTFLTAPINLSGGERSRRGNSFRHGAVNNLDSPVETKVRKDQR